MKRHRENNREIVSLTKVLINRAGSWGGKTPTAFNKKQFAIVGITGGAKKGWAKRLVGKEISLSDYRKLCDLKNPPKNGLKLKQKVTIKNELIISPTFIKQGQLFTVYTPL